MCVGIFSVGEIFAKNQILALCGVCFALYYAFLFLRAVFANSIKLQLAKENPPPLKKVIISTLLVTLANPHVYLDTVF
ncbi:LysE family transporter [Campylobacter upsaliensis]